MRAGRGSGFVARGIMPAVLLCGLAACQLALPSFGGRTAAVDPVAAPVAAGLAPEAISATVLGAPGALPPAALPPAGGAEAPAGAPAVAGTGALAESASAVQSAQPAQPAQSAQPAESAPAPAAAPAFSAEMAAAAASCRRSGGHFAPRSAGSKAYACFSTPRDAGRSCRVASDCSSACLARSMTCAPVRPLFGCHEILSDSGARMTQCLQ